MRKLFYLFLLLALAALPTDSFGQFTLNTTSAAGNGSGGCTFEVIATRNVRIHRVWVQHNGGSGNTTVDVWGRPGGMNNNITTANGWIQHVTQQAVPISVGTPTQIPVDLNIILAAGQSYGFYVGGGATVAYTTGSASNPVSFTDGNITINCHGYGGSVPNPGFFPRIYNGAVDYFVNSGSNDAGVASIDSVTASCPGTQNIWATIGNYGANQLDSVTVNWSWNGTVQTPIQLIAPLDTFGGTGSNTAPVFLGSRTFASGQIYNLSVWTSNPNGVADTANYNDTIHTTVGASLQGIYTINSGVASSGTNFNSFTDAVDALNAFGVCAAVTFLVAPNSGPYKEQISIGEITGASSVNTITFNGGPTREEIWVDAAMTSTANRHVIRLDGSDYVTLKNLTINNHAASGAGTTYGTGIHITNTADYNIIEDCAIDVDSSEVQTSGNFCGIQMAGQFATSSGSNGNHNIIRNNSVHGGFYGITAMGAGSTSYGEGNRIENNTVTGQWYYNMYSYYQSGLHVEGNHFEHRKPSNTFGYGLLLGYQDTIKVIGNVVQDPLTYGIYLTSGNRAPGSTTPSGTAYVINNSVGGIYASTTCRAFYFASYCKNMKVYHNSGSVTSGTGTTTSACYIGTTTTHNPGLDVQNNSFANFGTNSGYALYGGSSNISVLDNNNYWNDGDTSRVLYLSGVVGLGSMAGAAGHNTNSYHGDPLYIDNFTDLHSKGTQLWDRGNDTLGVMDDIDGDARPGFGGLIPDIGCDEYQPPQLDISPSAMLSPTLPICPGTFNVIVNIQNFGQDTINSYTVNWSVNGVTQTPVPVSNTSILTNQGAALNLGSLNIVGNTPYDILFWTTVPNGGTDEDTGNDTLAFYGLRTGLAAGNYIINSGLPTGGIIYNSFQDAVDDLNDFGICGSVNFIAAPGSGPYEEQIVIGPVVGTSATSTITFDGGPSREEIFADSVTNTNQRAVITIDGGDWVTIKNLRVSNHAPSSGTWYAFGVHLLNGADHNTIEGCDIEVDTAEVSTSSFRAGLILSAAANSATRSGNTGEYNVFRDNKIHGGYYGLTMMGGNSTDHKLGNRAYDNEIMAPYYYGLYNFYQDGAVVEGNTISMRKNTPTSFGYAMYTYYCDSFTIAKNQIIDPRYIAMYFYSGNRYNTATSATVENNMIMGEYANTTRYGIYLSSYNRKINFYHNSVSIPYDNGYAFRTVSRTGIDSLDLRNNSFAVFGNGGYPVYLLDSMQVMDMNYNNYYSMDSNVVYMNNTAFGATNYRGAGTWNIASRFGDPGYVNNWNNLHVKGNQLWNAGNNGVGVLEDIDGQVRPDSFIVDIGADEFRPPAQEVAFVTFVEPVSACGYSATSNVIVQVRNAGLEQIDSLFLSYRMNNGTVSTQKVMFNPAILSGATANHTFTTTVNMSTPGRYEFDAWAFLPGDTCFVNDSLHDVEIWHDLDVNTFPHFEDFESGPGGWRAQGNGNWQWGLPRGTDIDTAASGVKAWMTDTVNSYQNGECSWILSPCYDFTTLNLPYVRMFINYDSEASWDGTQLQATTDSGRTWVQVGDFANTSGTQVNWYNDNSITGLGNCLALPFNQQEGWTNPSFGQTSGGWIQAEIIAANLANEPDVRFRVYFGSDGSVNTGYDGFAMDDFEVGDVPPNDLGVVKILDPSSGSCGDSNTVVTVVVKNYGSLEQYNYPVSVVITDTPNVAVTTLTIVAPDTLYPGQTDTLFMGTFNTYAGGQFTLTSYTNLTGDLDRTNDTLIAGPIDIIGIPAPPVVADQIFCEADSALLAVMNPDTNFSYNWYATDTSTVALAEDTFQLQTPLHTQTTTYWVQQTSRDGGAPILITEFNLGGPDMIEIQNLSSKTVDATGWFVATSNSYTDINNNNTLYWQLGTMTPGQIDYRTDGSVNNWGNNLFYNPGSPAWVMIIDNNGNVVDALFAEWSAADIANFNTTLNGVTITGADIPWTGNGVPTSGSTDSGIDRIGNSDNDDATDWIATLNRNDGTQNSMLSNSFSAGLGCSSLRVPVQVIISPITAPNLGPDNVVCGGLLLDAGAGYAGYSWNNGPMTQQNFVNLSGQYNVTVSDVNGCTGTDTINLIINPNPIVDLGPDSVVCGSILLDAGNPGASWTWSDGSISQTYLVTSTGQEFVNVVDANGCETRDTVDITVNALPALDLGIDRVECDSVLLDVNNPGLPVLWDDGSTNQTRSVTASGSYFVSVTDPATTCEARDTVNLTINVSPVVNLGPDGDYCDILILDAQNPGSLYNWSTGDLSQTVIVTNNNEGTINVEVTDINGCAGIDTITVNIVDQPVIGFNEQRMGLDTYNFTNNSTGENITYSWDFGDGSAVETTRDASHMYAPGFYQACLTIANACDTLVQCVDVHAIGVGVEDELLANSINLYPNPTTDKINIDIAGLNEDVEVTVSDVTGRILFKDVISRFEQSNTTSYDLSEEAKGVYTVIFKMGEHRLTRRVVLK